MHRNIVSEKCTVNVREFIEMTTAKKPSRKSKNNAHDELNNQSE